jgi:hypothetical protein
MRTVLGMSHFHPFLKLFIYIARAPDMFLCLLLYITRARINRKRFVKAKNLRHAPTSSLFHGRQHTKKHPQIHRKRQFCGCMLTLFARGDLRKYNGFTKV